MSGLQGNVFAAASAWPPPPRGGAANLAAQRSHEQACAGNLLSLTHVVPDDMFRSFIRTAIFEFGFVKLFTDDLPASDYLFDCVMVSSTLDAVNAYGNVGVDDFMHAFNCVSTLVPKRQPMNSDHRGFGDQHRVGYRIPGVCKWVFVSYSGTDD